MYMSYIAQELEKSGQTCYLPQRDGFKVALLIEILAKDKSITPDLANKIAFLMPYYLDLGHFLKMSKIAIADLDDDLDSGMLVEISYAKLCNLPVIGVRTDTNAHFGSQTQVWNINPFPIFQSDIYIKTPTPVGDFATVQKSLDEIIAKIKDGIKKLANKKNQMDKSDNPVIKDVIKGAEILFDGVMDIHSEAGIKQILKNFMDNQKFFLDRAPENVVIESF